MAHNQVQITDREGWTKVISLEKTILHIGADPYNDLVLDRARGGGVASRHAQLIFTPGAGYQMVNLGDTPIITGPADYDTLPPHSSMQILNGKDVTIGDFILVFHLEGGLSGGLGPQQSQAIGLRLSLPRDFLIPDKPLEGAITVTNLGEKPGVQFKIEVEGIHPDTYDIGAAPVLFPNVSKAVPIRFRHQGRNAPQAGEYHLQIYASAQEAYPGEIATVTQTLHVAPFYDHAIRITVAK